MLHLCAGMLRSGSTWLYNAVRLIDICMYGEVYGRFEQYYDRNNPAQCHIIKCHGFNPWILNKADKVFVSTRDPLDVAGSMVRCKMAEPTEDSIRAYLSNSLAGTLPYLTLADLVLPYEWMIEHKHDALQRLAIKTGYTGIGRTKQEIYDELERIGNSKEHQAEDTYMGAPHVTDGRVGSYKDTLTPELIAFVTREFGGIRKRLGYS